MGPLPRAPRVPLEVVVMTVNELIYKLASLDPKAKVLINLEDNGIYELGAVDLVGRGESDWDPDDVLLSVEWELT